ncbi:hypothetical protein CJ026_025845 [Ralstonia pickettii]|uniref:hypothetical protein n=1 Tax=Ralstonia pickettii TaxID=329 RepID=UPI000CD558DC|nr:hypothetical protein CJ026_025845 [Ralstonia pickettii]
MIGADHRIAHQQGRGREAAHVARSIGGGIPGGVGLVDRHREPAGDYRGDGAGDAQQGGIRR